MVGKLFCGFNVESPNVLEKFDGPILIFSIFYFKEIEAQIKKMGFKNKIIIMEDSI